MANQTLAPEREPPEISPDAAIQPAVHLWTDVDFKTARGQLMKSELIVTGIGLVLMLASAAFFGRNLGGFLNAVVGIVFLIGIWMGIGRWLTKIVKPSSPSFEEYRNMAAKPEEWFRDVTCSSCGKSTRANIGYYEYSCLNCGAQNMVRAALPLKNILTGTPMKLGDLPEELIPKGQPCTKCSTPNPLAHRPAWLTCPHCKSRIELECIPIAA